MTDAPLQFQIDSSQVPQAQQRLDGLATSAGALAEKHDQLIQRSQRYRAESDAMGTSTAALRDQFYQASSALDQLLSRLDAARARMSSSSSGMADFTSVRTQVDALATSFGQSSVALELYSQKASSLGLSSQQTVYSLQRITDALQAQTAAGRAIRGVMEEFGVSLKGLTANDAELALTRYLEKMRGVADSAQKFRDVQTVLGPVDPTSYGQLNDPNIVPEFMKRRQASAEQMQAQVNDTARSNSIRQRDYDQNQALTESLSGRFTLRGPAGLSASDIAQLKAAMGADNDFSREGTSTPAGRRAAMRWMDAHPDDSISQGARTYSSRIGDWADETMQRWNSGRLGQDYGAIEQQVNQQADHSTWWGQQGARFHGQMSAIQALSDNVLGTSFYQRPPEVRDNRPPDPAEERHRQDSLGNALGQWGDTGYADYLAPRRLLDQMQPAGNPNRGRDDFISGFGPVEGFRRYQNTTANLGQQSAFSISPGAQDAEEARLQAWISSLPREHQEPARQAMQFARTNKVYTGNWGGAGLGVNDILNPDSNALGALGTQGVTALRAAASSRSTGAVLAGTTDTAHQIELLKQQLAVAGQVQQIRDKLASDQKVDEDFFGLRSSLGFSKTLVGYFDEMVDRLKQAKDEARQFGEAVKMAQVAGDLNRSADQTNALSNVPMADRGLVQARIQALGQAGVGGAFGPLAGYAQTASQATGVPPWLLSAIWAQESDQGATSSNIGQILPGTAASPGFGMSPISPNDIKDPAKNTQFSAQYFAARAKAAGVTDFSDMGQIATALRAYNGGGDPSYVEHVLGRAGIMPGQSGGGGVAAVIAGSDRGYLAGVHQQASDTYAGMSAAERAAAIARPSLAAGAAGAAALARAAIPDPNTPVEQAKADAARRVSGVRTGQQDATASAFGSTAVEISTTEQLTKATQSGSAAAMEAARAIQVQKEALQNLLSPSEQAARNMQLLSAAMSQSGLEIAKQDSDTRTAIVNAQKMADAWKQGAGAAAEMTTELKTDVLKRAIDDMSQQSNMTDQRRAAIDKLRASLQGLVKDNEALAAAEQEALAYQANAGRKSQNELTQANIDAGPFATDAQLSAIQQRTSAQQYVRDKMTNTDPQAKQDYLNSVDKQIDLKTQADQMNSLRDAARQTGDALMNTFEGAFQGGAKFGTLLGSLAKQLEQIAFNAILKKPLENGLSSVFGGLFGTGASAAGAASGVAATGNVGTDILAGVYAAATGAVFQGGAPLRMFGGGGLITSPTYRMMATGGVALMGESDTEAVMPLKRLPNGNLGIQATGAGGGQVVVHAPITVNQQGGGGNQSFDAATQRAMQKQIENAAQAAMKATIANEKRPGGSLWGQH